MNQSNKRESKQQKSKIIIDFEYYKLKSNPQGLY